MGIGTPEGSEGGEAKERGRPLPPVLAGAGVGAVAIALLLLAGLAVDRWPFGFDRAIITGLRAWHGPAWLPEVATDITALGSPTVLTLAVAVVAGLSLVQRRWRAAAAVVLASASGAMVVTLLKSHVVRLRPDLVPHLVPASGYSFPSGHATSSAVVYLTLAALAGQGMPDRAARRYIRLVALLLVGAIGTSRVYLGVHWPSDVMAGWSLGTLWALGWWLATARSRPVTPPRGTASAAPP